MRGDYHVRGEKGGETFELTELTETPLTPTTPQAGNRKLHPKSSGWHEIDDGGVERRLVNSRTRPVHGARLSFVSVTTVRLGESGEDSSVADSTGTEVMEFTGTLDAVVSGTGTGGLDTGSEAADTWYAVHLIGDTTGANAPAAMLSLSATAPTLPGTHDIFRRVGWVRNDGSSDFIDFRQFGRETWRTYMWANAAVNRTVLSGGNATGSPPTVIPGIKALVPPTSQLVQSGVEQKGTPTVSFFLSPTGPAIATLTKQQVIATIGPVDSNQEIFYSNSTPSGNVDVTIRGFYDEI